MTDLHDILTQVEYVGALDDGDKVSETPTVASIALTIAKSIVSRHFAGPYGALALLFLEWCANSGILEEISTATVSAIQNRVLPWLLNTVRSAQ